MYDFDKDLENSFATLEGPASVVIKGVIENGLLPKPRSRDLFRLLVFAVSLWSRTPAAGREISTIATQTARAIFKNQPGIPDHVKENVDKVEFKPKQPIGVSIGLATQNIPYLLDLGCLIIKNESEIEFITSDAPVVFFNQWCQDVTERGTKGFIQSGLQIFLPISPRFLVLFYDRSVYKVGKRSENPVVVNK